MARMTQNTEHMPGAQLFPIFLLRLALVASLMSLATSTVTIRNWTSRSTVVVTSNPRGSSEELLPSQWIQYTCTNNGKSAVLTVGTKRKPANNVATIFLYDGQNVALVDNMSDSIDGILVDDMGKKIQTLFINL
ncbi:hypothetical protein M758_3G173100 [Ceratodon purpureus]|nr:hypothetical protein M758_3G173100 [Ceratodon purpureus]